MTLSIKRAQSGYIDRIVKRLNEDMEPGKMAERLREALGNDVLVIPCPRSAPLLAGALWPSRDICESLVRHGLAHRYSPMLERFKAVTKSSTAGIKRPKPLEHYDSMRIVNEPELAPKRITIVDDVITKGATSLAAASHIQQQFSDSEVMVFALVRTKGLALELDRILDPVMGEITFDGNDSDRQP